MTPYPPEIENKAKAYDVNEYNREDKARPDMSTIQFHPLADIFPAMEGPAFEALVADIKEHGVREPLVIFEDQVVDGRNRYRAAKAAGITITDKNIRYFDPQKDGAPLAFVISKNLQRRHLDESQRAMVAAKIATMKRGNFSKSANLPVLAVAQTAAAKLLNVSDRSVRDAVVVKDKAATELKDAVEQGHLPVSVAAKAAKLPAADQKEIAKRAKAGETARKVVKQKVRKQKEKELGAKQVALPNKRYGVILADPEWRFGTWSESGRTHAAAENHYPTSDIDTIKARKVASISANDCVLFLWTPVPMLPQALEVMKAWSFEYKSNFAWVKDRMGTGFWCRNQHELLLVGTRGNVPAPAPGLQWPSVITAPAGEHSAKPEKALELIEAYFPSLPKIELNRRGPARRGWDAWGNEVRKAEQPSDELE
jgi:N6-adenosine-specific RNA methylase IME4/ParB-like chromosome segregation protein Spo0J